MLKFIVVIASLVAVTLSQTFDGSVSCYGNGSSDVNDCTQFINEFCSDVSKNQYRQGDSGSGCFNIGGNRCDFIALNTNGGSPINNNPFNNGGTTTATNGGTPTNNPFGNPTNSPFGSNDNPFNFGGNPFNNNGQNPFGPSQENCQLVLQTVAQRCRNGGSGGPSGSDPYTYTIDPNSGACRTNVQGGS